MTSQKNNGIIITFENICFQSHETYFNYNDN